MHRIGPDVSTNKIMEGKVVGTKVKSAIAMVPQSLIGSIQREVVLPQKLAEVFRQLILTGEWKPGSRLIETGVAKQFRVAQPTVREALRQLESEGLVLRRPYRSCEISSLKREEVDQILRLRVEWESLAAELAVENRAN